MESMEDALETDSISPPNDNSNLLSSMEDRLNGSTSQLIVSYSEMKEEILPGQSGEDFGKSNESKGEDSMTDQPIVSDPKVKEEVLPSQGAEDYENSSEFQGVDSITDQPIVSYPVMDEGVLPDEGFGKSSEFQGVDAMTDQPITSDLEMKEEDILPVQGGEDNRKSSESKGVETIADLPIISDPEMKEEVVPPVMDGEDYVKASEFHRSYSTADQPIISGPEMKEEVLPDQEGEDCRNSGERKGVDSISSQKIVSDPEMMKEEVLPGQSDEVYVDSCELQVVFSTTKQTILSYPEMEEEEIFPGQGGKAESSKFQGVYSTTKKISYTEMEEEEVFSGQGGKGYGKPKEFPGVYSITKYPESLREELKGHLRCICPSRERWKPLEELPEQTSEWDLWWDGEGPSPWEVSVDEERIQDPLGVGAMEARWWVKLLQILESQEGFARHYCPYPSELSLEEAATPVEPEEGEEAARSTSLTELPDEAASAGERRSETEYVVEGPRRSRFTDASLKSLQRRERAEIFWTRSRYEGIWDVDLDVPSGKGIYRLPYGVTYAGEMHDGNFDGEGVLHYPDGSMVEGVWSDGQLLEDSIQVTFRDGLKYDLEDWDYCTPPDRRFQVERLYGLRGAGRCHLTQSYPTRTIPEGLYDTGDGFYDPATRCVVSAPPRPGRVLRIPTDAEAEKIKKTCRKAWDENVGYFPHKLVDASESCGSELIIPSAAEESDFESSITTENDEKDLFENGISRESSTEERTSLVPSERSSLEGDESKREDIDDRQELVKLDPETDLTAEHLYGEEENRAEESLSPPAVTETDSLNVESVQQPLDSEIEGRRQTSESVSSKNIEPSKSDERFETGQESIQLPTEIDQNVSELNGEAGKRKVSFVSAPQDNSAFNKNKATKNRRVSFVDDSRKSLDMNDLNGNPKEVEKSSISSPEMILPSDTNETVADSQMEMGSTSVALTEEENEIAES